MSRLHRGRERLRMLIRDDGDRAAGFE
jgi:hypothetical protein